MKFFQFFSVLLAAGASAMPTAADVPKEVAGLDKRSGPGIVAAAVKKEGLPYVCGGGGCKGPTKGGFDCSG